MKKWIDWALAWVREASSPAGLSGVIAGLLLVVVTDALLLGMRYIQELPPVAVTFLLSILIAAIRWGLLAGAVTSIGGVISLTCSSTARSTPTTPRIARASSASCSFSSSRW